MKVRIALTWLFLSEWFLLAGSNRTVATCAPKHTRMPGKFRNKIKAKRIFFKTIKEVNSREFVQNDGIAYIMCLHFNVARLFFKVKFSLFPDFVTPESRKQIFYLKTKRNYKKTKFNQLNRTDWRFETQGRVDSETCAHIRKNPSYSLVKTGVIKLLNSNLDL